MVKKAGSRRKARELAFQALYQYDLGFSTREHLESLEWMTGQNPPSPNAVEYFKKIFNGALENLQMIDNEIQSFANKQGSIKMMAIDKAILRFGAYSLLFEKEVPAVILINEAVDIAKDFGGKDAYKFINGVLDGIRRKMVEEGQRPSQE